MNILEKFKYCPICGSSHFEQNSEKSKLCRNCGFEYFANPSSANVAFILNDKDELLVATRKREPAKGTLDIPGGFADVDETSEQGVIREVKEETGLEVTKAHYLFSFPNKYRYSGVDIPTLDMFYHCEVKDLSVLKAADDAANLTWIPLKDIHTELFGLRSVRQGLLLFIQKYLKK
ncbi:MAG: NUDIX domain-containing protein [Prevotella sp.]|jgi:ADP-ribose pyrophosphatase YjhB (NUDIX family)|nr:NUDIX domain-containing protein [Prevotella sp.]